MKAYILILLISFFYLPIHANSGCNCDSYEGTLSECGNPGFYSGTVTRMATPSACTTTFSTCKSGPATGFFTTNCVWSF